MKYSELATVYEELISTTKMLEKTAILAKFLGKVSTSELESIMLLLEGRVFPEWDASEIGIGTQLAIKAIASASGNSIDKVKSEWKRIGDLGDVSQNLLKSKTQATLFSQQLTVKKVIENLQKLAELEGKGTVDKKVGLLKELLSSANPVSAKYIVRTCLYDLRIGAGSGIIRDSLAQAFDVEKEAVQTAYDLTSDFGLVAKTAKEKGILGLKKLKINTGTPIKVMLYKKVEDAEEAFNVVGKPAAFEYKYDGFRLQIHRKGSKISLFTRRQEDVTKQFPDVVKAVKESVKSTNYVIDSEVIGFDPKTGKWRPFQQISQRIKRKYDIVEIAKKVPVIVNVFDLIHLNGEDYVNKPFKTRRKALEKVIKEQNNKIMLAVQIITDKKTEADKFYAKSLSRGNEGVMAKNLEEIYKPGSRTGYGVKIKPTMENLDLVIVGAEWGKGKRATWLSSFYLACLDNGEFKTIGKMGTGIKEKEEQGTSFNEITQLLKPLILGEKGKTVKVQPKIVVEVAFEEIQKSTKYTSGFALRFPRLAQLRIDRKPDESDTLARVKALFSTQRGR